MSTLHLEIELLSPVAASATSATVGAHETLHRVPGAMLRGAVAAALRLDPDREPPPDDWALLAEVHYGDALPVHGDRVGWPMPLALHAHKDKSPVEPSEREVEAAHNLAAAPHPEKPVRQLRDGHLVGELLVEVQHRFSLRTARDDEGRALEGFLFGIDALDAGQRFRAQVRGDATLLDRVRDALVDRPVRLGRSRSAEFGQVRIREVDAPTALPTRSVDGRAVVWCLSDLALRDRTTGMPRLQPVPQDFDLPADWRVRWSQTFVRTRSFSPFNGARRRPDLERQVLTAGSVIVLEAPRGQALDETGRARLAARVARGVGEHLEDGLGRVVVNAELLCGERAGPWRKATAPSAPPAPLPDDGLGRWLGGQIEQRTQRNEAVKAADALARELRRYRGTLRASQLGEVRRLAREARLHPDGAAWLKAQLATLFDHGARKEPWKRAKHLLLVDEPHPPEVVERAAAWFVRDVQEEEG